MIYEESKYSKQIQEYRKGIQHRFYPYAHTLILLATYELLLRLSFNPRVAVYNGVDIWFLICEEILPLGTLLISIMILAHRSFIVYLDWNGYKDQKEAAKDREEKKKKKDFKPKAKKKFRPNWYYFAIMALEGFVYGSLIYMLLPPVNPALLNLLFGPQFEVPSPIDTNDNLWSYHTNFVQDLALAFGSGFYDEYFFRYQLEKLLKKFFKSRVKETKASVPVPYLKKDIPVFSIKQDKKLNITVMVVSALIFSFSHFIFPYGDPFNLYGITYRFFFGLILYWIYNKYGLTIAAWTHVFYDLWYFWLT